MQFFWALFCRPYEKEVLLSFAKHYQTNESMPEELYNKVQAARNYRCVLSLKASLLHPEGSALRNSYRLPILCRYLWKHSYLPMHSPLDAHSRCTFTCCVQ